MKIYLILFLILSSQIGLGQSNSNSTTAISTDSIYNHDDVEVKPTFKGGIREFYNFVGKNYKIPDVEKLNGKVIVEFIVEKDGALSNFKVLRDLGHDTGKEAIKVLSKCPKWIPAMHQGLPVRVRYNIPITFTGH